MHTHPVAVNVLKYLRGDEKAKNTLVKIASKRIVIANTGANDWLESSGNAERASGGYRVTARKHFVSSAPGATLLVTSVGHDGEAGREVLHFAVPMTTEGITILDNWNTLGMRGTGSNDVALENVFVPDEAVVLRRPAGKWHPVWDAILPTALPIITSAYVGLAEAATRLGVAGARKRPSELSAVVGQMQNSLTVAELALDDMVRINDAYRFRPSLQVTERVLARKAIAASHVKQAVELASELVGGAGFFRGHPMERIVRDVRAMNFHPLPVRRQELFSGRMVLGLDPLAG
jgi:acyl-CoA dehydrogenase